MTDITSQGIFDVVVSLLVATLYGIVAWTIINRSVSRRARMPNQGFAVWWWGLAALTGVGAAWRVVLWFTTPSVPVYMAYTLSVLLMIMIAFAGMMYYFLYLWSGRELLWAPLSLFYLGMYVFFVYYIQLQAPLGYDAQGSMQFANDLSDSPLSTAVGLLLLVPPIIGAALYLGLLRKAKDRLLRFRIGIVASSILVWFLVLLGSSLGDVREAYPWWAYVSRAIAAIAAALTLIAYRPPPVVQRWLKLDMAPKAEHSVDM